MAMGSRARGRQYSPKKGLEGTVRGRTVTREVGWETGGVALRKENNSKNLPG